MTLTKTGRTVLVTGATAGIGNGVARRFLAEPHTCVYINGRFADTVAETVADLNRTAADGSQARPAPGDVTDEDVIGALRAKIEDDGSVVDVLVNNVGATQIAETTTLAVADWDHVINLNLRSTFLCSREFGAGMVDRHHGVIVNMASIASHTGMGRRAAYCAAKHAVLGLTRALAVEWADHGVRVVAVSPGYTRTAMYADNTAAGKIDEATILGNTPLARIATVEEIADVIHFLTTKSARHMTGCDVVVDGGWIGNGGMK